MSDARKTTNKTSGEPLSQSSDTMSAVSGRSQGTTVSAEEEAEILNFTGPEGYARAAAYQLTNPNAEWLPDPDFVLSDDEETKKKKLKAKQAADNKQQEKKTEVAKATSSKATSSKAAVVDSSSEISSDTSSDSSSDSESDDDGWMKKLKPKEIARILIEADEDEDDAAQKGDTRPRTTNEVKEEVPPMPTTQITPDMTITELGIVEHMLEDKIVIKGTSADAVDIDSLICTKDRKVVGNIDEPFGNTSSPWYTILFHIDDTALLDQLEIKKGTTLYYVNDFSTFVLTESLKKEKYTDASNVYDEEITGEDVDFSDDEKEKAHKRQKKAGKAQQGAARGQRVEALNYDEEDDEGVQAPRRGRGRGRGNGGRGRGGRGGFDGRSRSGPPSPLAVSADFDALTTDANANANVTAPARPHTGTYTAPPVTYATAPAQNTTAASYQGAQYAPYPYLHAGTMPQPAQQYVPQQQPQPAQQYGPQQQLASQQAQYPAYAQPATAYPGLYGMPSSSQQQAQQQQYAAAWAAYYAQQAGNVAPATAQQQQQPAYTAPTTAVQRDPVHAAPAATQQQYDFRSMSPEQQREIAEALRRFSNSQQ